MLRTAEEGTLVQAMTVLRGFFKGFPLVDAYSMARLRAFCKGGCGSLPIGTRHPGR